MKVAFVHVGQTPSETVGLLVASAKRVMPHVPVVHLTDGATPAVAGVDEVQRHAVSPLVALAVLELYALAGAGTWLFVDTDVLVQAPVDHVFEHATFDIAVASREGTYRPGEAGSKFMTRHPYNKGVVFSRRTTFWQDAATVLRGMKVCTQAWMGDQLAMNAVIDQWRYKVHVLDSRYNYPPQSKSEALGDKFLLHFKGPRKTWLMERAA